MRRSPSVMAIVLWFAGGAALPALQSNPDDVAGISKPLRGIVEKFVQASGGFELGRVNSEKKKGTLVRGVSGAVPFEAMAADSGKWHYHQAFAYGDRVCYGCDGFVSWIQDTQGVSSLSAQERLELSLILDPQLPLKLGQIFPEMQRQGEEKIGAKDAVVVAATSREGIRMELAFDRASGLLLRAGDLFFEDYREVGKVKRPYTVWLGTGAGADGLRLKMQVTGIQQNVVVDESLFAEPKCALIAGAPVLYTLRTEVPVSRESRQACVGVYQALDDPEVHYTVTRQGDHLMIERSGWGISLEILAASETDYFMRFLNREFHFCRDAAGRILALELGADRSRKAKKIN
jgi:hypothetical protein